MLKYFYLAKSANCMSVVSLVPDFIEPGGIVVCLNEECKIHFNFNFFHFEYCKRRDRSEKNFSRSLIIKTNESNVLDKWWQLVFLGFCRELHTFELVLFTLIYSSLDFFA